MTATALVHKHVIIEKVAAGELLDSIAKALGVKPPSISAVLASDPEYKKARQTGAELRLERAYSSLANAENDAGDEDSPRSLPNLARAREAVWRASAWFAEREFPERWGAKQQIEHSGAVLQVDGDMLKAAGDLLGLVRERVIPETINDPVTNSLIDKE